MKFRIRKGIALFVTLLLMSGSPVFSAEKILGSMENDKYFLDFKETKLINVLEILSDLTGINFVAGKEIANREVNMMLDNVTLQDALEGIARGSNVVYEFIPQRNIYLFRAAADAESLPPLVSRVFRLYYVLVSPIKEIEGGESSGSGSSGSGSFSSLKEAEGEGNQTSQIVSTIQNMLSERGKVNVDARSNSLIVTDTEDRLKVVGQVIAQLDQKLEQILIEVILIETAEDLDRFFGIEWSSTASEGTLGVITGGASRTKFPFNYEIFGESLYDKSHDKVIDADEFSTLTPASTTVGTKDFSDLTITLKALQTAQKVKVIAKPKILVMDNHPALIKITTNASIGQNSVATATGQLSSSSTTTTERTETGTSLRLTPHINLDGQITLTVEPRFVTLAASSVTDLASSTADPTIRTARTTMMIKDSETIVIGGLLSSQQTHIDRKVPYLGDMPLIGEAFTKRTKQIEDKEMILFITPKIVKDVSTLRADSIPDDRESFKDETAPFWKINRKAWYKNMFEDGDSSVVTVSKEQASAMDQALKNLSNTHSSSNTSVKVQTISNEPKSAG